MSGDEAKRLLEDVAAAVQALVDTATDTAASRVDVCALRWVLAMEAALLHGFKKVSSFLFGPKGMFSLPSPLINLHTLIPLTRSKTMSSF